MNVKKQEPPIFVWWQITHRCNLKCDHCFAYKNSNELTTEEAKKVVSQLSNAGIMLLKITGGEPLLRDDIFQILNYTDNENLNVILSTNGTLITKEKAKRLRKANVDKVQVSLDSADKLTHEKIRGKGTFDKTIRGIKNLMEKGIDVAIVTTLMSHNSDEISATVNFVHKLGVEKFLTRRVVMYGRAKENWSKLHPKANQLINAYKILREKEREFPNMIIKPESSYMFAVDPLLLKKEFAPVCECGKTQCGIKPDGTITPCEYVKIPAGNLKDNDFLEIWNNAHIFKKFRKLDISKLKGKCSKCNFKKTCKGGCRAAALNKHKDFYAQDPLCWWENDKLQKD